jgi:hypothetical protein
MNNEITLPWMSEENKRYFNECLKENDLLVMGIYNPKTEYSIFHKWGKAKDVQVIVDVMKNSAYRHALDVDYITTAAYPLFTIEDFDKFVTITGYFGTWIKQQLKKDYDKFNIKKEKK